MAIGEDYRKDDPEAPWNRPQRPRSRRKDTRLYCKGNPAHPHNPQIGKSGFNANWPCNPQRFWGCHHKVICGNCGKVLYHFLSAMGLTCPEMRAHVRQSTG